MDNDDDDGEPLDFTSASKRTKARRLVEEQQPFLLIGSPMCTAFSSWQALNGAKHSRRECEIRRMQAAAELHIRFVTELYALQEQSGRYFLH